MTDATPFGFGKLVPGFDFLQNLAKGAAQSIPQLPNLANWIAPTLNVEELDKRLDELKAVHFWLDQNSKALGATIQALEVQKMTLATLQGMNFNMGDVANALKLKAADTVLAGVQKTGDLALAATGGGKTPAAAPKSARAAGGRRQTRTATAAPAAGVVDPLQWWGALTNQFQQIAANAMKDAARQTAADTTKNMAAGLAKEALRTATGVAGAVTRTAAKTVAAGAARAVPRPRPARRRGAP